MILAFLWPYLSFEKKAKGGTLIKNTKIFFFVFVFSIISVAKKSFAGVYFEK